MNANATDTTVRKRVSVTFDGAELAAIAEFAVADLRPDEANAIRALTLLGLDSWRNKGRPKAHRLAVVQGAPAETEPPELP